MSILCKGVNYDSVTDRHAATGAREHGEVPLAERPKSFKDLRVGILENGKEFSDIVLEALAERLRREHGVTNIKFWRKGFPAKGAPFIDEMAAESMSRSAGSDIAVHHRRGASSTPSTLSARSSKRRSGEQVLLPLGQMVARSIGTMRCRLSCYPTPSARLTRRASR